MEETLLETVIMATGLPADDVRQKLNSWLLKAGKSPKNLSIDDLREALVHVLQHLFTEVRDEENPYIKISG